MGVACVAADASYRGFGYGRIGYGHNLAGYLGGYRGYRGYNGYNRHGNYARGYSNLHKRFADAEPEADAGYLRSAAYYAPSHYRYGGARSYEYRSPQGARGYAGRNYYGAGRSYYGRVHGLHKRSAEPGYFRRYYGSGRSYQAVYRPYSGYRSAVYHH